VGKADVLSPVGTPVRWASIALAVCGLIAAGCGSASAPPGPPSRSESAALPGPSDAVRATAAPRGTTAETAEPTNVGQARVRAQVLSVTDGDTIRVSIDGRSVAIRYIGIDTPETVDPRTSVECFGREATAFNRQLVEGTFVELEKDVSELDRFGRTLRYVWIERGSQTVMVNEELVRNGYATSSTYPPDVKYQERFHGLEAAARTGGIGLWGAVCAAASPTPVATLAPRTLAPATRVPTVAPRTVSPTARANCDAAYPTVCIPPAPPDLDCGQIPFRRFTVRAPDPHRFDADRDGIGCE
jgi:micrococcal nuclease